MRDLHHPTPTPQPVISRRHATLALLSIPLMGSARAGSPLKIEGLTFPGEVQVANTTLHLNGVGVRQVAWLKGYACALYLTKQTTSQAQALAMPGPKRVHMRLLIDAPSEEFAKAFMRGVSRNAAPEQLPAMQERMNAFDAAVRAVGKMRKGDVVDLDWRPGVGLVAQVNTKPIGSPLPGEELYLALLKIYIGDKPTDVAMKAGLLGLPKK
jgi:Chalcone isomerase-like